MAKLIEYNAATGETTITDIPDEAAQPITLAEAQERQISAVTQAYQSATQTIQSLALGRTLTYLSDDTSMTKFNAEYTFVNSAAYDGSPINWYTVEEGGVTHTKDQFNQVWLDGRKQLSDAFNRWDSLIKQIKSYTQESDVPSVLAITW